MHNIMSRNQLADWRHVEENLNLYNEESNLTSDYFDCLIECDDSQSSCKRICRRLLG